MTFGIGVGAMVVAMFFGMSQTFGRVDFPLAFWVNAALLVQFPVGHSLLLTTRCRRFLSGMAPKSVGRDLASTTYATIAAAQVAILFIFWTPTGTVWWIATGSALWLTYALYAVSWGLLLKSIVDAGFQYQVGLLGWWAIWRGVPVCYPDMPQKGVFRLVRQPIYVSFTLTLWTVPTWTPDQLVVAVTLTLYCLVGPIFKEMRFSRMFGSKFADYQHAVPYWIPWRVPKRSINLSKNVVLNDQTLYQFDAAEWWTGRRRWLRTLQNLVPARIAVFNSYIHDWSNREVLDLGCGGGFFAEEVARRGALVTGIDPSVEVIDAARLHSVESKLSIAYQVGVAEDIPAADQSFDIVVCVDVLEHVTDFDRVISEVRRVLRPNGWFLFDTINRTFMANFVIVTLGERILRLLPRGTHDPSLFKSPEVLQAALTSHGFSRITIAGFGPRGLNRHLDLTFGRVPIVSVMYIGAAHLAPSARSFLA